MIWIFFLNRGPKKRRRRPMSRRYAQHTIWAWMLWGIAIVLVLLTLL